MYENLQQNKKKHKMIKFIAGFLFQKNRQKCSQYKIKAQ